MGRNWVFYISETSGFYFLKKGGFYVKFATFLTLKPFFKKLKSLSCNILSQKIIDFALKILGFHHNKMHTENDLQIYFIFIGSYCNHKNATFFIVMTIVTQGGKSLFIYKASIYLVNQLTKFQFKSITFTWNKMLRKVFSSLVAKITGHSNRQKRFQKWSKF